MCAGAEVWPTPAAPPMISASNLSALSSMPALACAGQRAVDSRRRLCAVAAQKGAFVEEQDAAAVLEDVRGGEPREASADDDDLFGHDASFPSSEDLRRDACVVPSRGPRTYEKAIILTRMKKPNDERSDVEQCILDEFVVYGIHTQTFIWIVWAKLVTNHK